MNICENDGRSVVVSTIIKDFTQCPPRILNQNEYDQVKKRYNTIKDDNHVNNKEDNDLIEKMIKLNINNSNNDGTTSIFSKKKSTDKNTMNMEGNNDVDDFKLISQISSSGGKPGETNYKWLILEEKSCIVKGQKINQRLCRLDFKAYDKSILIENNEITNKKKGDKKRNQHNLSSLFLSSDLLTIQPIHIATIEREKNIHIDITYIIQSFHILPMPVHISPVLCMLSKQRLNQCWSSYDVIRLLYLNKALIMKSNDVLSKKKNLSFDLQYKMALNEVLHYYNSEVDKLSLEYQSLLYTKNDLHPISSETLYYLDESKTVVESHLKCLKLKELLGRFSNLMEKVTVYIINTLEIFIIQCILFTTNVDDKKTMPLNLLKWPSKENLTPNLESSIYNNFLTQYNSFFADIKMGGYYVNVIRHKYHSQHPTRLAIINHQFTYIAQEYTITDGCYKISGDEEFLSSLPDWLKKDDKSEKEHQPDMQLSGGDREKLIEEYRSLMMCIQTKYTSATPGYKPWISKTLIENKKREPFFHKSYLHDVVILETFRLLTLEHPKWFKKTTVSQ